MELFLQHRKWTKSKQVEYILLWKLPLPKRLAHLALLMLSGSVV
jgi:hypothetical protein